jgi:hypothetical protein
VGIATAGFPNLFMLYGPNTNNGSIIEMIESQVAFTLRQIERIHREDLAWLDVKRSAQDRYNESLQHDIDGIDVWQADCSGYYRVGNRVVTQWPHGMDEFRKRTREPDSDAFEVGPTGATQ